MIKLFSLFLALTLTAQLIVPAWAETTEQNRQPEETVADLTQYTEGDYSASAEGNICGHEHTVECYQLVTECVHTHGDCGYVPAVEGHDCDCQPDESGVVVHMDGCGFVEAVAEVPCNHVCSEETGCIRKVLNCQHQHDDTCGYAEKETIEPEECETDPIEEPDAEMFSFDAELMSSTDSMTCEKVTAKVLQYKSIIEQWCSQNDTTKAYWNKHIRTGSSTCSIDGKTFYSDATAYIKSRLSAGDYTSYLTTTPCPGGSHSHPKGTCYSNEFGRAWTCNGFANYMNYIVFGLTKKLSNGSVTSGFESFNFVPGDIAIYSKVGSSDIHFRYIYDVDDAYVYYVAGNDDGLCGIRFSKMTIAEARKGYTTTAFRPLSEVYKSAAVDEASVRGTSGSGSGESITPTLSISNWRDVTDLKPGSNFGLRGTISTDYGVITSVTGEVLNSGGSVVLTHTDTPNTATYNIQTGINNYLAFEKLSNGRYTIKVRATANNNGKTNTQELVNQSFNVGSVHSCVLTKTEAVAPTYFAPGNNEYYTCVTCGKVFKDAAGTIETTVDAETLARLPSVAYGKCGDNVNWVLTSDGTLTISGSGAMSNFSIYQNVAPWLENCDKIARVIVEPGVTSIGGNAFQRCSSLSSVRIPESVTSIGDSAFSGCSGLTSITIPEGVASIGNSAFYGCSSMTSVTIPEAVTSIGNGAFWGCSSLTSVKIPESVTSIEGAAFRGCSGLTSITIPEGVASIGSYAFQGCSSLSSITIPEAVTSIEGSAFQGCSSLTSITIPEGVASIGSYAFFGCSGLSEVHLSNSVSSIGEKAFDGCNNLADVFYSGTEQQWNSIQISEDNTCLTNATLHFNSAEVISGSCGKNLTWAITEDGVLKISGTGEMQDYEWCEDGETVYSSAPWGRMGIIGLELGEGITRIGECAFLDCADISGDLILPRTLKQIGECAFSGCYGLTGVLNFPENLEEIESCAFQGCYGLYGTLQLPSKISYIGGAAFNGCSGFTGQLEIPMNVQRIDDWAFLDCSGLTNVSILGEVATIGNASFSGCSSLESVGISEGTVNIGSCAFAECTALESIFIPKSVETIDESAFEVCNNLKNVNYGGAKTDWNQIQIAKGNASLLNATIHYQIQSAPEIRPVDTSTLDGGATLKLTLWSIDQDKQIGAAWSLAEGSEAYASITASGTLTAKAVIQPAEITVIAQPTNGEPTATKTIRITPKATALLLMRDGEVLGETLDADMYDLQTLTLTAIKNTMEEAQGIHWSTSAKTVAQVDAKGLVTLLKPGRAVIQATDSGKLTGKVTLNVTYTDKSPRLEATTLNLNTALSGGVRVDFVEAYGNGVEALQWNDERFLFEYQENRLTVSAKDALKNGTYPVSLTAACGDGRTYEYPLTLKVTNTLPKVTVKQTAKLNLFYRDSRAPLVISAPGQRIENAELTDTGDFALENTEEGWKIVCTTDSPKPDTKGTLNLYLEGYREPVKAALNIGTVSTAPRAKLSATSSTVNSGSDLTTQVKLLDNSGKPLELEAPTVVCENASVSVDGNLLTITLDEAKSTTVTLYLQDSTWARSMKLTHKITVSNKTPTLKPAGSLTLSSLFTARTAGTAMVLSQSNLTLVGVEAAPTAKDGTSALAESEKLRVAYDPETGHMVAAIRDPGKAPKAGTYSFACTGTLEDGSQIPGGTLKVTVSAAAPKIKLSATSVKLNQYLAGEEQGRVRVTAPSGYQVADFTGKPEGMSFDEDTGMLTVTLEDASHRGGTYTLYPLVRDVETGEEVTLPTKLSFQVRAYNSSKLSVSLSAKGKLDTQTDGEIAYTVTKLTNCLGTVENVDLVGQDGDLFQADMDLVKGKPTVHLTLVSGSTYATNKAYKIQLRFYACGKKILSPVQTVKVTQTALKVTAPKTVTYYQAQKAPLRVALTANLPMDTVALNSKTAKEFQSALGEVTLNGNRVEFEIANPAALTAGKSYAIVLDATPENNAKNIKPVTVKLTVKVRK